MTIVYTDPLFQEHHTGPHPETEQRLVAIEKVLTPLSNHNNWITGEIHEAPLAALQTVHNDRQIAAVEALAQNGGGHLDPDTVLSPRSYEVARFAAGTCMDAVDRVLKGDDKTALCLIRPPGHHALEKRAMGFCLFNNAAIAARHAQKNHGLSRILIIDWDVHHGNGTQDIFYADENIFYLSLHRFPFYPGTGAKDETGTKSGLGYTLNLPVTFGTSRDEYLSMFTWGIEKAINKCKPDLIIISAGFDAHEQDPIGSLGLKTEDFARLTEIVKQAAAIHGKGRIVSCLEGGYHLQALAASVGSHLQELLKG